MAKPPRRSDESLVFEALASALATPPLDASHRDALRRRVLERVHADSPPGTRTVRAASGEWQNVLPLVDVKVLHRDPRTGRQTALYRLQPGAELPAHRHTEAEECYVVEGEVNVGDLYLRAGDYHHAAAGSLHPALRSGPGALLLLTQTLP
jgi:quercetin dioxygenase-like cupin family protein